MHDRGPTNALGFPWIWNPRDDRSRMMLRLLLGLAVLFLLGDLIRQRVMHIENTPYCDFFGFWSFARFVATRPPIQIYDLDILRHFESSLGPDSKIFFPFRYPPTMLPFLLPLSAMPYWIGYELWVGGTLALFLFACLRHRFSWMLLAALLAMPALRTNIIFGQGAFLFGALLIGGLRLLGTRPVLAGVLFGLLTCKPHLGLLVPVALVAAGAWRSIAAAAVTVIGLAVVTTLLFGASIWPAWLEAAPSLVGHYRNNVGFEDMLMPTVAANLRIVGLEPRVAMAVQAAVAAVVAAAIWACFRRGPNRLGSAALLVGAFLATPFAFSYDMVIASTGVVLFVWDSFERRRGLRLDEVAASLLLLVVPLVLGERPGNLPVSAISLLVLFALIVVRALRDDRQPASGNGTFFAASAARHRYQAAVER